MPQRPSIRPGRRAAAPPTKGATVYREGKSSSIAAPEALAVGGQPERDYNKRGAGPFPMAHREPPARLINVKAPPPAPA